jgi:hypothetical protein
VSDLVAWMDELRGQGHVHEPLPGSVWDADGVWRHTSDQVNGREPFEGTCRTCFKKITRTHESEWQLVNDLGGQEPAPKFGKDENL